MRTKNRKLFTIKACRKIEKHEEDEEKIMSEFNSETNNLNQQLEFDTEAKTDFSEIITAQNYENTDKF
jgi:hypothetical protein